MSCFQGSMLSAQGENATSNCPSTVYYTFLNDTILANLSVADELNTSGQLSLSNISINEGVDLQNTGSLLATSELASDANSGHLISVQPDHAIGQTLTIDSKVEDSGNELSLVTSEPLTEVVSIVDKTKKKGGWPKGKKRKKEPTLAQPRAPATGYMLFAYKRRQEIKDIEPKLAFRDITKILGNEWSSMGTEEKQKYLSDAENDKKRYIDELDVYKKSPQYLEFVKKRKIKITTDDPLEHLDNSTYEEVGLHCRLCNLYFSSNHNKKEHMLGKLHLTNLTSAFEKEQIKNESTSSEAELHSDLSQDASEICPRSSENDLDPNAFIVDFMRKNQRREIEIKTLNASVKRSIQKNLELQVHERLNTLRQEDVTCKAIAASLNAQMDSLKMVPALFGMLPSTDKTYDHQNAI
ncbi:hypothetical protein CAPTEDRAFT_191691 [Capitella teleta]|uniref:HMG box domain-containing protein n=1 Tax=Capitella teleta TaxID=283909 RepID=R7V711_CAPTE|nr:hypothetical protein CAPTEDRAFT_191691 [Capitella teleta]|eukprot:ELU14222.1 hypothetical protein CAPTEDRAFT_191691 [Capitella teleta]